MKKVLLFLAVLFSAFFSFAYEFTCPYKNIDEKAKGTYVIKGASSIYYILNEKVYPIDQQRKKLVGSKYSFIPFFDKKFIPSIRYEDFIQFDKHGNAYVLYQIDEYDGFRKSFVFKYDPVKEKSSIFEITKTNPYALSFTVSDDGEYIFIHYFDRIKKYEGYVSVAAIPTRHPEKIEILLSGDWTEFGHMTLKNLCFDSNTKNLYFNYGNRVNEKDRCIAINSGLYILKPENGKYLKKNLKKFTSVKHHEVNDLISFCTKNGMTDFGPAVRHIKSACDSKYKPEEIEISLKCFKDFSDYSILYKEDENGKPLTDEAALEYLYKGGPEIFGYFYNFMCWYCNSNDFEYEFTEKIFPCEYLCLVKETGESAYTADRDFVHSIYSIDDGFLFSNKDGLWGLYMVNWKYISIYHITDSKGKFIKRQDDRLKEIRLTGIYDRKSNNLLVTDDYFIFIQSDGKKIYCVKDGKIHDMSPYLNGVEHFNYSHIELIIKNDYISNLDENQLGMEKDFEFKSLETILFPVIAVLVIALVILIWRNIVYRRNRPSVKKLKKNKKFIFDIQEAERGRVSRDIHDSVIQDIRSIRLNSEMLEVTPDSEDRKQQVIKMATDCVINLRNICYNLTPAELATHADGDNSKIELVSIIQTLVTQFIERTHVPCSIQIDESFTFPIFEKEISQNLFRIIQEALTNIEKHSYATKCSIFIRSKDDGKFMVIYISDDGIGCDIQSVKRKAKRNHFGLKNMMDRAKMIGAEFEIESTPGEGMETRIILPVKAN